jgi:hypothetical protein
VKITIQKITIRQSGDQSDVCVLLTEAEAERVAKALRARLNAEAGYRGPGYRLHIKDGEGSELTIGVLDPE